MKIDNLVRVNDFITDSSDCTMAVMDSIEACIRGDKGGICFDTGRYYFKADKAFEKYYTISNNDSGLKKSAFPLIDIKDFIVDGNNSTFVFKGRLTPFIVQKSHNIELRNFSIDNERPFFTAGLVIDATEEYIEISIDKSMYPYKVDKDSVIFYSEDWEGSYVHQMLEYVDGAQKPAFGAKDTYYKTRLAKCELMANGNIRIQGPFSKVADKGNLLVIKHEKRLNPAIFITESKDIVIKNVNIYQSGTMGVISQLTENITMNSVCVMVAPGSGRPVSTNTDGSHFINCRGNILIENCLFESQMDDAVNIHGNYFKIQEIISADRVIAQIMHIQQKGVNVFVPKDKVAFIDPRTLCEKSFSTVKSSKLLNLDFVELVFEEDMPKDINIGDGIDNVTTAPKAIIRKCRIGKNRARGVLIKTSGEVIIEENHFYTEGAAVKICCDMINWYEGSCVKNVTIRNNFIECYNKKHVFGTGVIDIDADVTLVDDKYCMRNITIEGNNIATESKDIIYANNTENLTFTKNIISIINEEKCKNLPEIIINECKYVKISDNKFKGAWEVIPIQGENSYDVSVIANEIV